MNKCIYVCMYFFTQQLLQKSQAIAVKQKQITTLAEGLKDQEVLLYEATELAILLYCRRLC